MNETILVPLINVRISSATSDILYGLTQIASMSELLATSWLLSPFEVITLYPSSVALLAMDWPKLP